MSVITARDQDGRKNQYLLIVEAINSCKLQYVYQDMDPNTDGDHGRLPWRVGLLTKTNSPC
jgi:hypothetical protein